MTATPFLADTLPRNWQLKRLKFIARVQTGMAKGKDLADADTVEVPYLRVANVQDGYLALDDVATMTVPVADLDRYRLQPGDVLMNEGGDFDKLGRGHVWHGQIDPCIHQNHVFAVRPHGVSPEWLNAWTGSAPAQFYFMGRAKQSTNLASISSSNVMELPVPVPPPEEQVARLVFIDRETARIDALIAKKTRFIALLREKRQALTTQAVTRGLDPDVEMKDSGVEWLGRVPAHWTVGRFGELCASITTGPFGSALAADEYVENGVPVINPSHIGVAALIPDSQISVRMETANRLANWQLMSGDLVVGRRGELGRAAIVSTEQSGWLCGTGSMIVRPNTRRVTATYLHTILSSQYSREWLGLSAVGATMPNLNETILGAVPCAYPPTTNEQVSLLSELTAVCTRVAELMKLTESSVNLLQEHRSALITATVTGQLDPCHLPT